MRSRPTPAGTWRVSLGDLYATAPRPLGLIFHVDDVEQLGPVQIGEVRIEADVVLEQGIEHRTIVMPVMANLDAADHVEPVVERTLLRFEAAKAREAAIRRADLGDYDGAANALREAGCNLLAYAADPDVAREIEDLKGQAERLAARLYDASDRKYDAAMAMGMRDGKEGYLSSIDGVAAAEAVVRASVTLASGRASDAASDNDRAAAAIRRKRAELIGCRQRYPVA